MASEEPQHKGKPMTDFEYMVIGKGLLGCAATHYLSQWSQHVAVLGPDEPADFARHQGVFASHYDQGRQTRLLSRSPIWSEINRQAMLNYPVLQAQSGMSFYRPVGALYANADRVTRGNPYRDYRRIAQELEVAHEWYEPEDQSWREPFPDLDFPAGYSVLYEPAPAGYVNPRDYLRAELTLAEQHGAVAIRETAVDISQTAHAITIDTAEGNRYTAAKVLVAAGAFTNCHNLLPYPLDLPAKTETVILGEVSAADASRLEGYPTVLYRIDDPDISDIYMTPPIQYPNGRFYIKMGCNTSADSWPKTLEEMQAWFRDGDSNACHDALCRALDSLWPSVDILATETKRCMVCYTPSGHPSIDRVEGALYVATGGNGGGATGSDTLGRLAAGLVFDDRWPASIPRQPFRVQFLHSHR